MSATRMRYPNSHKISLLSPARGRGWVRGHGGLDSSCTPLSYPLSLAGERNMKSLG